MTSFTGNEFVKALSSEKGLPSTIGPIVLCGMVKPAEHKAADAFLFSPGTSCQIWFQVPSKLIEKADQLGKLACRDHQHDYVCLHFKAPTTEEGQVFSTLLQQQSVHPLASEARMPPSFSSTYAAPSTPATMFGFPSLCSLGCGAVLPVIYPQVVGGLALAKALGLVRDKNQCKEIASDGATLAAVLYEAMGPIGAAIAYVVAGACGRCACDQVF